MARTVQRPLPEPVEIGPFRDEDFDAVRALLVETACITPPGFTETYLESIWRWDE